MNERRKGRKKEGGNGEKSPFGDKTSKLAAAAANDDDDARLVRGKEKLGWTLSIYFSERHLVVQK